MFLTSRRASVAVATLGLLVGGTGVAMAGSSQQGTAPRDIANLGQVKTEIKAYYGDTGTGQASAQSDYAHDVSHVETLASNKLPKLINKADDTPVVLVDVDDTTLLTYNYEATHDFGYDPVVNAAYIHDVGMPAVFGMPNLLEQAVQKGAEVYYLTGRPETQRADTLRDLQAAGYPDTQSDRLYMRNKTSPPAYLPCEPTCTTVQYKSMTREHINAAGNDIVLNMGDQFSDLQGGFADKTLKLPNPMYFLP